MAAGLKQALAADVSVARDVLSKKLGDIVVEERDDGAYAQMGIGPELLPQPGPMFLRVVAGAGFEPATFGL